MNNNEWIKSTKKPEESGFYLIHVFEAPKIDLFHKITVDQESIEYVVVAEYNSQENVWMFKHNGANHYVIGNTYLSSHSDYIKSVQIIEWKTIDSEYTPVKRTKAIDGHVETASKAVANVYDRYYAAAETARTIERRNVDLRINGGNVTKMVLINSEEEFNAYIDYISLNIKDYKKLVEIRPNGSKYEGEGYYLDIVQNHYPEKRRFLKICPQNVEKFYEGKTREEKL